MIRVDRVDFTVGREELKRERALCDEGWRVGGEGCVEDTILRQNSKTGG